MITSAKVTIAPYGNVAKRRNQKPAEIFSSTCETQTKDATVMGMAKLARTTMNAMMNIVLYTNAVKKKDKRKPVETFSPKFESPIDDAEEMGTMAGLEKIAMNVHRTNATLETVV
eukprot:Awhi_evm1s10435